MILTTIAIVAQATPAATSTPDAAVAATAKAWFSSLQQAKVLDAKALTDEVVTALTPDVLSSVAKQIAPLADPTTFTQTQTGVQSGMTFYVYAMTFKNGAHWNFLIAFDEKGKISALRVVPAQ